MPNEVLRKSGDDILFGADAVNPSSIYVLSSTYTKVGLPLNGLATAASVQSDKVDLGARRAPAYNVDACIEFGVAPTAGNAVEFYWAPSTQSVAANGNPGGVVGASGAYVGGTGGTDDGGVNQLQMIGQLTAQAVSNVQIANIGVFSPMHRYGTLVVKNECGQTLNSSPLHHQVLLEPVIDEVQ
jgi:hypothetical protein